MTGLFTCHLHVGFSIVSMPCFCIQFMVNGILCLEVSIITEYGQIVLPYFSSLYNCLICYILRIGCLFYLSEAWGFKGERRRCTTLVLDYLGLAFWNSTNISYEGLLTLIFAIFSKWSQWAPVASLVFLKSPKSVEGLLLKVSPCLFSELSTYLFGLLLSKLVDISSTLRIFFSPFSFLSNDFREWENVRSLVPHTIVVYICDTYIVNIHSFCYAYNNVFYYAALSQTFPVWCNIQFMQIFLKFKNSSEFLISFSLCFHFPIFIVQSCLTSFVCCWWIQDCLLLLHFF